MQECAVHTGVYRLLVAQRLRRHPHCCGNSRQGVAHAKADFDVIVCQCSILVSTALHAQQPTPPNRDAIPEKMPFSIPYGAPIGAQRAESPVAGRRTVSLGYQFTLAFGANNGGFFVKRYRDEGRTADIIEVQLYFDAKIVAANAAYLWLSAVA